MRKIVLLFSFIILSHFLIAQSPAWQWAVKGGGVNSEYAYGVATDQNGNIYITGSFRSASVTFGSFTLTNNSSSLTEDIYLVKYNSLGNVIWARREGDSGNDVGQDIVCDVNGNIYISGFFRSPTITFGTTTLTNQGLTDMFIVKFDPAGNVIWARSAGGSGYEEGRSIDVNAAGDPYVAGIFSSVSVNFGNSTLNNSNTGTNDLYIVRYDASGNDLWAANASATGTESAEEIAVDGTGNAYITGYYNGSSCDFGNGPLANVNSTPDAYVAKFDPNGNIVWADAISGSGDQYGRGISLDASGNVYATGTFTGASLSIGSFTLTNNGSSDIYTVSYSSSGTVTWAVGAGGATSDYVTSIHADNSGNTYLIGNYSSNPFVFGSSTLIPSNSNDDPIFLLKYTSGGSPSWGMSLGSTTSQDNGANVTSDQNNNIYITGSFSSSSIAFGTNTLLLTSNSLASTYDVFLAQLGSSNPKGINQVTISEQIHFYQDPLTGELILKLDAELLKYNPALSIYNSIGQEVYSSEVGLETNHYYLSELSCGVYFYRLDFGQKIMTGKILFNIINK